MDYVLEGSVRRDGERVRITAQLIRVKDQIHLWAENYDRQLPGILEIHGEIGAAIAAQFLYHADRDSEALEQFNATLGMESRFWVGQICVAKVYEKLGMYAEALVACDRALECSGGNSEALSLAG